MEENEIEELRKKIQSVLDEGQTKLIEVSAIADGAKQKETELNIYHSRIIELKAASEANSTSLSETLSGAVAVKNQIDELHRLAVEAKAAIDSIHQDGSSKSTEINNYYNTFKELEQKVEHPETGIGAMLSKATEFFGQISKTNVDSAAAKEEIITNKVKTETLLNESGQIKASIALNLADSERLKMEIGKILDLVRDTGLANSFDRRRKRSQWSSLIALGVIVIGVIISAVSIYKVFLTEEG